MKSMNYNLVVLLVGLVAVAVMGCGEQSRAEGGRMSVDESNTSSRVATLEREASSPSGRFRLRVVVPDGSKPTLHSFEVLDRVGNPVFAASQLFDDRSMTYWLWDDEDRVWVYSGDLGTFFWQQVAGGDWRQYSYAQENVSAPPFLKAKRPRWHRK